MFPREIFLSVGAYPEAMTIGCEDWALYLRIAAEYEYGVVPEFLCGYRQVGSSMSRRSTHMTVAHDMLLTYLRDSGLALSAAQVRKSRSSLYLWLLFLSRPFSRDFFSLAQSILRNDMFIMFRRATLGFVLALARSQLATARAWMNGKTHPSFYERKPRTLPPRERTKASYKRAFMGRIATPSARPLGSGLRPATPQKDAAEQDAPRLHVDYISPAHSGRRRISWLVGRTR